MWKKLKTFKYHVDLQSQAICFEKENLKETLHILEDGASGCASGHIEQVIVIIFFKYD